MRFSIYDKSGTGNGPQAGPSTFASTAVKDIQAFAGEHQYHFMVFPAGTECDELILSDLTPYKHDAEWTAAILRVVAALASGVPGSTLNINLYPSRNRVLCLPALAAGVGTEVVNIDMRVQDDIRSLIPPVPRRATPLLNVSVNSRIVRPPNK